jgi:predicted kinase
MIQTDNLQKTAVIFIGIPGSGKSTFYERYFRDKYVRINLDTLRTRTKERALLEECLASGRSFVVDNTNPTAADRQRYIAPAKAAGYLITGFFFQSSLSECLERNNSREGKAKVPAKAVAGILRKLEQPSCEEGFDHMYVVKIVNGIYEADRMA